MPRLSRREFLAGAAAGPFLAAGTVASVAAPRKAISPLVLNDASRLNLTRVAKTVVVTTDDDARIIDELRALLKLAADERRPVCIGGARHSMGGQSLAPNGIAASFVTPRCEVDTKQKTYRVRAGTRWRDVIATLDPLGFSVAVMQSNHDFSVGGTLSVNAHGWPVPFGPFGSTVRSFRLMLADGMVVNCSRNENQELFGLAIGGYGLFGIILDVEVEMVENVLLEGKHEVLPAAQFAERFVKTAKESVVRMAYGRLSVARRDFLTEALLVSYRPTAAQPQPLPTAKPSGPFVFVTRQIFRAQTGSERGKQARWYVEKTLGEGISSRRVTRNEILNYPVSALADSNARRTDILHEYFIPPEHFAEFLDGCRRIVPRFEQDILNVTLRYLEPDTLSTMAFAPEQRIAAVMLFAQQMTTEADNSMRAMTQALINHALALGGSFYLPYRLHARTDQVKAAYPSFEKFVALKRRYDPETRFSNLLWEKYFT